MQNFHTKHHMHVTSVTLRIKDEGVMLDYYINILKMKIIKQEPGKFYLGTKAGNILLILEVDSNAKVINGTVGLYHYALLLPSRSDLANFLYYYLKTKARFVGASDHYVSEAVYLEDPEGNGIEIYVDRPAPNWRDLNNNIYMTTERLDLEDLFQERSGDYTALPNGTIMGHLHLHVSDLTKGEVFYNDVLGFTMVFNFPRSANFVSDHGYHHHLGYNVWRSRPLPVGSITTGLVSYTLNVPASSVEALKVRLRTHNIPFSDDNNTLRFKDINNSEVIATSH